MEKIIDQIYEAIFRAYTDETNPRRKAMYDDTLTILANINDLVPELFA